MYIHFLLFLILHCNLFLLRVELTSDKNIYLWLPQYIRIRWLESLCPPHAAEAGVSHSHSCGS